MFSRGDPAEHGIYVAVEDADAHHEQEIEDTDYGSREYTARDLEGNLWSFGIYRPSVS